MAIGTETGGSGLYYETVGTGPPLLVMHAPIGIDHSWFKRGLRPLARERRIVYFDQRGNGRSKPHPRDAAPGLLEYADDAAALCASLELGPSLVLGHSAGVLTALALAERHPELVAGLVLCSPAVLPGHLHDIAPDLKTPLALMRDLIETEVDDGAMIHDAFLDAAPVLLADADRMRMATLLFDVELRADALEAYKRGILGAGDPLASIGRIARPALVIAGARDRICTPESAFPPLQERLATARYEVFEGSGHFPFDEEPARFADAVRAFAATL